MPTYIILGNYTDQGMRTVLGSPTRLEAAKGALKKLGGELKEFYLTVGNYDMVAIVEVTSDEVLAKFALAIGASGNVRTISLKAFSESEYRRIILGSSRREISEPR